MSTKTQQYSHSGQQVETAQMSPSDEWKTKRGMEEGTQHNRPVSVHNNHNRDTKLTAVRGGKSEELLLMRLGIL